MVFRRDPKGREDMSEILNGQSKLSGWAIAMLGGRLMLGKLGKGELSPVYDFGCGMQPTPQGQLVYDCAVLPPLGINSVRSLPIPADTILVHCEELTSQERGMIERKVIACDELLRQVRAAASGITLAKSMPGVKP
jgi:hypothetical protein